MRGFVEAAVARGEGTFVDPAAGDPAEHRLPDRGRLRASASRCDHPRRLGELPRPRPAAARGGLGADDQREPLGPDAQPWAVLAPSLMIALLTISVNLVGDAVARTQGISASAVGRARMSALPESERGRGRASTACASSSSDGVPIVDDVSLDVARRRDPRARRRVGLGQDDDRARAARLRAAGTRIAGGTVSIDGHALTGRGESALRALRGPGRLVRAAEPGVGAQPVAARRRRASADVLREHGPARRARRRACSRRSSARRAARPTRTSGAASRTSSPAASSSASRSRSALVCEPAAVVMDEPTTGLDVVTQARILEEVDRLRRESGSASSTSATTSRSSRRSPTASP